jgi:hypothetical protein
MFVVLAGLLGVGCKDDAPLQPYADMIYSVRCQESQDLGGGGCLSVRHDINDQNGENGLSVSCAVGVNGDSHSLNFRVVQTEGSTSSGVRVENATFNAAGLQTSTACRMTFTEGANTYTGACGSGQPTPTQPCQMSDIRLTMDSMGNPQVEGDILCKHLALQADPDPTRNREFTHDDSVANGADHPFSFRLVFCTGL